MHRPGYVQGGQQANRGYLLLGVHHRRIHSFTLILFACWWKDSDPNPRTQIMTDPGGPKAYWSYRSESIALLKIKNQDKMEIIQIIGGEQGEAWNRKKSLPFWRKGCRPILWGKTLWMSAVCKNIPLNYRDNYTSYARTFSNRELKNFPFLHCR